MLDRLPRAPFRLREGGDLRVEGLNVMSTLGCMLWPIAGWTLWYYGRDGRNVVYALVATAVVIGLCNNVAKAFNYIRLMRSAELRALRVRAINTLVDLVPCGSIVVHPVLREPYSCRRIAGVLFVSAFAVKYMDDQELRCLVHLASDEFRWLAPRRSDREASARYGQDVLSRVERHLIHGPDVPHYTG